MRPFGEAFTDFIASMGFKSVSILTSTMSPIRRERVSNRDLPDIYGYVNDNLYKSALAAGTNWYDTHQIKQFGHWLGEHKKKPHQELEELAMAGSASKLLKLFNKVAIPCSMFVQFTPGGIDFVGGFTYYSFLKNNFDASGNPVAGKPLGKPLYSGYEDLIKSGEDVHKLLFEDKKVKTPAHWVDVVGFTA